MKTIDDVLNEWNKVKTNGHNIGEVLKHYLVCAIWADGDEEWSDADIYEMSIESADYAGKEIINFLSLCGDLLEDWTDEQIGHDFWLTRQGHGAGFWDRAYNNADEVTAICEKFRSVNLWRSECDVIYIE